MVNFDTDPNLGQVIKSKKLKCMIGAEREIRSMDQLAMAAGARKLSELCGFMFESALPKTGNQPAGFQIVYKTKLRNRNMRMHRSDKGDAGLWYSIVSQNGSIVALTKDQMMLLFNFDIDKFFDSDYFNTRVANMQKVLRNGVLIAKMYAKKFRQAYHNVKLAAEAEHYIEAIEEAIPQIAAAKYYDNQFTICTRAEMMASYDAAAEEKLDAVLKAIHAGVSQSMDNLARASSKREKYDAMLQKIQNAKDGNDNSLNEGEELLPVKMMDEYASKHFNGLQKLDCVTDKKVSSASLVGQDAAAQVEIDGIAVVDEYDDDKELDKKIEKALKTIYK